VLQRFNSELGWALRHEAFRKGGNCEERSRRRAGRPFSRCPKRSGKSGNRSCSALVLLQALSTVDISAGRRDR